MRSIKIYTKEKLVMMNSEKYELLNAIENSDSIAVVSHINPDGDNLGSLLGLGMSLVQLGKEVAFIRADIVPEDYKFLPGIEKLSGYGTIIDGLDLLIILDCSDPTRLGENQRLIDDAKIVVNIDHHISNTMFGDIKLVDPKASSTGELVFDIRADDSALHLICRDNGKGMGRDELKQIFDPFYTTRREHGHVHGPGGHHHHHDHDHE